MTLLIIQYRAQPEVSKNIAYELLRRIRPNLNWEEPEHITGRVREYKESLEKKRIKQATKLCKDAGIKVSIGNLSALSTLDHRNDQLFDRKEIPHEWKNNQEETMAAETWREEAEKEE